VPVRLGWLSFTPQYVGPVNWVCIGWQGLHCIFRHLDVLPQSFVTHHAIADVDSS
jgi:hypothetical protein